MEKKKPLLRPYYLYYLADLLLVFGAVLLSFVIYYGPSNVFNHLTYSLVIAASTAALTVIVFFFTKIYKVLTNDIGLFEVIKMSSVTGSVLLAEYVVVAIVAKYIHIRALYYLPVWLLLTASLCLIIPSMRLVGRLVILSSTMITKRNGVRTLVVGAGATAKIVVDESRRNKDNHNKIVVFVDDDINKIGGMFANLPVKGPIKNIQTIIEYYKIEEVIIAMSKISQERLREILALLDGSPVRVRRMPLISEMQGPNDRRIIDVDLNDLLARDPVILDNSEVKDMLKGQTVLVTGAGGSIGSELVRQIFNVHPKNLILFDIYENSTYDIQMELVRKIREEKIKDINLITLIGSTYNDIRIEQIMKEYHPDYIYHAAAYKHVPLMEDSPAEAIRTNVIGTYNVARLADKYGVKKMVLVSTDKAVRPTNVMGATKRFAETIIQYYAKHSKTKYAAVRFGNVLGSNGSVVPLFKKQIEAGGPITITDKEIIRYFMTIPEAVSLILQCGLFAEGGEIFILDMGQPVKIISLAERLIRQAGLVPYEDIDIIEVGLRPGEKLYEELLIDKSRQLKTPNKKIFIEPSEMVNEKVLEDIKTASKAFGMDEKVDDVKELLQKLISNYHQLDTSEKKKK